MATVGDMVARLLDEIDDGELVSFAYRSPLGGCMPGHIDCVNG